MEMHAAQIIALLITGLGVGFASGMLGGGGGGVLSWYRSSTEH